MKIRDAALLALTGLCVWSVCGCASLEKKARRDLANAVDFQVVKMQQMIQNQTCDELPAAFTSLRLSLREQIEKK